MNCPKCNQVLAESARFCPQCGMSTTGGQPSSDTSTPTQIGPSSVYGVDKHASSSDPMIGQVLENKYEIIARLGEGGMGAVYRARRVHIGDEVAVKVLHEQYVSEASALERFRREARAAAMLQHPNIVSIYDYGEAQSKDAPAFIVMELVKGRSLRSILEREGKLAPARAVALMRAICAGVGAAHRSNIVHRDIKPDNIIIRPPEAEGEDEMAKVLDFGIAKLRDVKTDQHLTQTGAVIGTPYYMSPEQCRAEDLDSRSDVYSLGAMLYEMIAGAPPFSAATVTGVVAKHLMDPPPPLAPQLGVPPAIEAAIMRALAKDPNARQSDASVLARELQIALADTRPPALAATQVTHKPAGQTGVSTANNTPTLITASAQPAYYSTAQPAPRSSRAGLFIGAAIAILVLLIGGGAAFWFITKSNGEDANRNIAGTNQVTPPDQNSQASSGTAPVYPTLPSVNNNAPIPNNNVSGINKNSTPAPTPIPPVKAENKGDDNIDDSAVDDETQPGRGDLKRAERKVVSGELLDRSDIAGFSALNLKILRNAIYARHGRSFNTPALQRYFNRQPWYRPRPDYRDSDLTSADRANLRLIMAAERY